MTVKELIQLLSELPEDYKVYSEFGEHYDPDEIEKVEVAHRSTQNTPQGVYLR